MAIQTAGGPDPTGMRQARNIDSSAGIAGRAKAASNTVKGWWGARKERNEKKDEEKWRNEARVKAEEDMKARSQGEKPPEGGLVQGQRHSNAPDIDVTTVQGNHVETFKKMFIDAIKRGNSRTEQAGSADSLIKEVVCSDLFVSAIANGMIKTPLEEVDTEYQKDMAYRRQKLAANLKKAQEIKEFIIPDKEFTTHELDIILTTMLGSPEVYEDPMKSKKQNAERDLQGAADLWKKRMDKDEWPEEIPLPHEALFIFIENAALRHDPEKPFEFIGHVCKDFSSRNTFTKSKEMTTRTLMDGAFINDYLYSQSAYPIDRVVENFHSRVSKLLAMPTDEMHSELHAPGLGYEQIFETVVSEKRGWVAEAQMLVEREGAAIKSAKEAQSKARTSFSEAEEERARMLEIITKAKRDGKVRLKGGIELKADDPQLLDALHGAENRAVQARKELEDATIWENASSSALEKARKDLKMREDAVIAFEKKSYPAAIARELANDFKSKLEQNIASTDELYRIGETISKRLVNPKVQSVADEAFKVLKEREILRGLLSAPEMADQSRDAGRVLVLYPSGNIGGPETAQKPADAREETKKKLKEVFSYKIDEYRQRVESLKTSVRDSNLPQEVAFQFEKLADTMTEAHLEVENALLASQLEYLTGFYGRPLKKAAELSLKPLGRRDYQNMINVTGADKVLARMIYEARSGEVSSPSLKEESGWKRKWQWIQYIFKGERWIGSDRDESGKPRGLLVRAWNWSLAEDFDSVFRPKNWFQRIRGRRHDGTRYIGKAPRLVDGLWGFAWKGYLVGGLLAGLVLGQGTNEDSRWYKPWHWPAYMMKAVHGGPVYVDETRIYLPWTLMMPDESQRDVKRIINDDYDDWRKLDERGGEYYKNTFGIGTKRLQGENSDSGMEKRLGWAEDHPDVLRFLQERTTLNISVRIKDIGERPENCGSVKPQGDGSAQAVNKLSKSCKALGVVSDEKAAEYLPREKDQWLKGRGMRICCTIEKTSKKVPDGMMINTAMADRFVAMLMDDERKGNKINYKYVANAQSRVRWMNEGVLVTQNEAEIIRKFSITERDNVFFLLMQTGASKTFLPTCDPEAISPLLAVKEHRDEFVSKWRAETAKRLMDKEVKADPLKQIVSETDIIEAFNTVRNANMGWFSDRTHAYLHRQVLLEVPTLNLETDTAVDVLVMQRDVLDLVKGYLLPSSKYYIVMGMGDAFIQKLDMHKRVGGSLGDYDASKPEKGRLVESTVKEGYLAIKTEYAGASAVQTPDSGASAQSAEAPEALQPALPIMTPEAENFYGNTANENFKNMVEGAFNTMLAKGPDSKALHAALSARFSGDRMAMKNAVKADLYNLLTSSKGPDINERSGYGLGVNGEGAGLTVDVQNPRLAGSGIRGHIRRFAMGL